MNWEDMTDAEKDTWKEEQSEKRLKEEMGCDEC